MNYKLFLALTLIFLINSCALKPKAKADLKKITARELLARNEKWQKSFVTLKGSANITLDSPQYSGNFGADVLMNRNDSLLITITGPMGIKLGKVFVSPKRFVFYNQMMNQFMSGSLEDYEDTNFMQFPVEVSRLRNVFAAREDFNILELAAYQVKDGYYYLETGTDHLKYRIWFDPAVLLIKKVEYYDGKKLVFFKEYDQFEKFDGVYFPRVINFVRPDEKQGLSIYYNELIINKPSLPEDFDIKILDSAKQIELSFENNNR